MLILMKRFPYNDMQGLSERETVEQTVCQVVIIAGFLHVLATALLTMKQKKGFAHQNKWY